MVVGLLNVGAWIVGKPGFVAVVSRMFPVGSRAAAVRSAARSCGKADLCRVIPAEGVGSQGGNGHQM